MRHEDQDPLYALSPLDGRYLERVKTLIPYCSEYALIRYRLRVEIEWYLFLNQLGSFTQFSLLNSEQVEQCRNIWRNFTLDHARQVRKI